MRIKPLEITIIGFGNVGSTLAFLLLEQPIPMRINIMQHSNRRDGALLDMAHTMVNHPDKDFVVNDESLFENADFVFYAAGVQNVHGQSRLSTAEQNRKMTQEIFCNRNFTKDPYIIVISNPVDLITRTMIESCSLTQYKIIGTGTHLDSMRLAYYLGKLSGHPPHTFDAWILGEHGDSQVPIYSMTTRNGKPVLHHPEFTPKLLSDAAELTRNAAFMIRETQNGTMYGIASCAVSILHQLRSSESKQFSLSVKTNAFYNDLLGLSNSMVMSLPVNISQAGIEVINNITYTTEEIEGLKQSAKVLSTL